ncbi:uncharacterized protein UV8b_06253 [Ustilaginoidea virens]|uniref:UspA domain-containing protein n=1 Tax=Ustilaginoidea virens TaxID=1159556 RepID=A0A8E5MJV2_USTVR|nr:uncharacterized protein UV8b_06253 [Ustilaginoidea virens]QUC22012.1 hypothetical protein UV8b_06253 [Ustilaginoidea virens]
MLTFAGRPKSTVFGRHRTGTSTSDLEQVESQGARSRLKKLSLMMHSSRPAYSPALDVSPTSSPQSLPPVKEGIKQDKLDTGCLPPSAKAEAVADIKAGVAVSAPAITFYQQGCPPSADASPTEPRKSSISFPEELPKADHSSATPTPVDAVSESSFGRKSSVSSISFRRSRNPSVAPSRPKQTTSGSRIRAASPPPQRFQYHVGFDNVPSGEATKNNTLSFTLNVRHKGYNAGRRSRCFMVGVDEHSYSDYAIQWLLDELVDDGDEIVCVRVIEKDTRFNDKQYQEDAQNVMRNILSKNGANRAISFILEYTVGKLHATFQKLIQMYQPAMLIVGTRGRSLGGIQGLVNSRNSFSKYCLQYSPIPVVVVRPTEKRIKKKVKRANDATRQTYLTMLARNNGLHEADSETSSSYELETQNSPDEEAHQVAKVLGLPAAFDPTIKPLRDSLRPQSPTPSPSLAVIDTPEQNEHHRSPGSPGGDTEEDEEEEEEEEFDVMDGRLALNQQQKLEQLHKMEVGEAAALKKGVDDDEEESDEAHESKEAP